FAMVVLFQGAAVSNLQSPLMQLSSRERRWLPWLGGTGKLAMGWSCWLNRQSIPMVEEVFEGIAQSRARILQNWVATHWEQLDDLAAGLGADALHVDAGLLEARRAQMVDPSELFVIDPQGRVVASTHMAHVGLQDLDRRAVDEGLRKPFLHGPYPDALTQKLGATSSRFHDAVTLMFYQ